MNYDPIHDTYSHNSEQKAENVQSAQQPQSGQPESAESKPAELPTAQESLRVTEPAPNAAPPNHTPQISSYLSHIGLPPQLAQRESEKKDPPKVSINNMLGSGLIQTQTGTPFQDEEDDDEDEEDEDDEDEDDEDDMSHESLIQLQGRTLGQLPPNFRAVSKGFKHLKKADGEPFWRKDIQFDFLDELFRDETRVFTNNFPFCQVPNAANGPKLTFAELYVRTLAESLKSSRVLRERLIKDKEMGISVSKVCLLVNAGRMNTTVNFVPDMRSALRTYHLIPSLQASRDGPSKPLQDTPRLKTILKAVCDGQGHLQTLLDLLRSPTPDKPNTNVIKLIFLMGSFFQNIPFHHDESLGQEAFLEQLRFVKATPGPQNKFMEFFLGDNIYPKNRARRFLWLVYTYLETSFTAEDLEKNPFNPKVIPPVEIIRKEDVTLFDNDEDYEVDYAAKMYHTRMMHLNEEVNNTNPKRGNKSKVERQRIRKQLTLDHHYRPGSDLKHEDMADDLSIGDETIQHDEPETGFTEHADESGRASYFQKFVSGSKRKKPTPSVGSLVDFSRKDALVDMKWLNPEFPLRDLDVIRKRNSPCTRAFRVPALTRDCQTSVFRKIEASQKLQRIVDIVSLRTNNFEQIWDSALANLKQQLIEQCANGNGLLALEWDSIRSDLTNGIEAYLYQQFGKTMATQINDRDRAEERLSFRNPDYVRKESFMSGTEKLPGDLSPIDIDTINEYGSDFTPIEKFNEAGERSNLELTLIQEFLSEQMQKLDLEPPKPKRIRFDLNAEDVVHN